MKKITVSSTKFYQCLSSLPAELLWRLPMEIFDGKDYNSIKDAVFHILESSKPELFGSLLRSEQLVSKTIICLSVSQRTAAKVGVGEDFVRQKLISSLPANITSVLTPSNKMVLAQLGTLADNLVAFSHKFSPSLNAP